MYMRKTRRKKGKAICIKNTCEEERFTTAIFKTRNSLTNYSRLFHYAMEAMKQWECDHAG